jgi:hypothetical protein
MRVLDAGCGPTPISSTCFAPASTSGEWTRARRHRARPPARLEPNALSALIASVEGGGGDVVRRRSMDVVISSARAALRARRGALVAMVREMWRVLKPGGCCRAPRDDGRAVSAPPLAGVATSCRRDERYPRTTTNCGGRDGALGGTLLDPLKSTVVHEQRSMGRGGAKGRLTLGELRTASGTAHWLILSSGVRV